MKVAVIGAGRWGKNHVRTLHEMGALAAIIEMDESLRNAMADQYECPIFSSLESSGAMDFDAYTVAVPAQYHHAVAKQLMQAGKHVLVEKPITLNAADAEELVALAKSHNVQLCVGHLLLFHPAFLKMGELISSGKIGKLQYLYSNRLNLGTVRKEENSLWSFAPHDISLFQHFIGGFPDTINSSGGAFLQPHIHDSTMTMMHYPDNVVGHIFVSWLHPFKEHRFVVIGSKGMLSFEDSSSEKELLYYEKGIDWVNDEPVKRDGATERIAYEAGAPLQEELTHFIAVASGKIPNDRISGEAGMDVLKILEQAQQQLDSGPQKTHEKKTTYFAHETAHISDSAQVGEGCKIWNYCNVLDNAKIGKKCVLGQNVNVGNNAIIGNYVKIQNNVSVYEGVELEDYVFCGPSMVFTNIMNPRSKYPQAESKFYKKTLVKEGTSIGANATIVCGTTLGRFSFVGAGAVVTKDVPDYALMVGNPARQVGWMSEGGIKLEFDEGNRAFCEKSKHWYELINHKVVDIGLGAE